MKKLLAFLAIGLSLILIGCASTTSGGATDSSRSQFLLISSDEINASAAKAYTQTLQQANAQNALNANASYTQRVKTISNRLIKQVGVFRKDALKWKWEVNVISSDTVNAYCMPGGKIAVYTGIISALKLTDDELAAVIGHEISHALREHSREKISQELAKEGVVSIASSVASIFGFGQVTQSVGGTVGQLAFSLPFSRTMETESDIMGMELMARAGYNPESAITVWQKMSQLGGNKPAEILSTHPSDESRIENLRAQLPKVQPLYQKAKKT